jgi:glycosyltransferase involved in cell wall biosynthesis
LTSPTAGAGRRPHVLYVAWGFPPHRGPGTYRVLASANLLVELGARVTVLTADRLTFDLVAGGDDSLLDRVDPAIRVLRVPFPVGRRDTIINRWPEERVLAPVRWADAALAAETAVFPEPVYGAWRPAVEQAASRLHRADPVDLVLASGNPYVDFAVAQRLNADHDVPFVLDDRDSWVLDVYTGERSDRAEDAERLLGWMLGRALELWFVNPPIADWHRRRWPEHAERIRVVENGWDPSFLSPGAVRRDPGGPLVVTYVGTISKGLPLEALLAGWRLAREQSPALASAELRFYGQLGHSGTGILSHTSLFQHYAAQGVRHLGRWPKDRIGEVYADTDVMLFAKEGSGMVTSGKVYEYVATGLPVVSLIERRHDARRVLGGYPRWHPAAEESPAALAAALIAAAADSRTHDDAVVDKAREYGLAFRRDQILEPVLRELLAKVAG